MNKFIKEELEKINTPIEKIDDTHYHFPKMDGSYVQYEVGKTYIIKLADYITNPPANFTLQDNWNKGVVPKTQYAEATILDKVGKMHKTRLVGLDKNEEMWYNNGCDYDEIWLPEGGIKKIKLLEN